ncbi:MAG: AIR synthase-related protein, partial [Steroidobacteraceae bacterium]
QGDLRTTLIRRHEYPTPRVALGCALRGVASACVDVSDGLAADASRLAAASGCGLELDVDRLPLSPALRRVAGAAAPDFALQGGEDFELLFAVPPERESAHAEAVTALGKDAGAITRIGRLEAEPGLRLRRAGEVRGAEPGGYDHFRR